MVIVKNLYLDEEATVPTDCLCLLRGFAFHHPGDDDDEAIIFGEDDDDDEGAVSRRNSLQTSSVLPHRQYQNGKTVAIPTAIYLSLIHISPNE